MTEEEREIRRLESELAYLRWKIEAVRKLAEEIELDSSVLIQVRELLAALGGKWPD